MLGRQQYTVWAIASLLALSLGACQPSPAQTRCVDDRECPAGYRCRAGVCQATAGPTDAAAADGTALDAAPGDHAATDRNTTDRHAVDVAAGDREPADQAVTDTSLDATGAPDADLRDGLASEAATSTDAVANLDSGTADSARPEASVADQGPPADVAISDVAPGVDATVTDVSVADAPPGPDVQPVVDAATAPDTAVAADTYDPCGNHQLDLGEACDSQPLCGDDCQPVAGADCGTDSFGNTVCFPIFPPGAPAHLGFSPFDPLTLPDAYLGCISAVFNTEIPPGPATLCGMTLPAAVVTMADGSPATVLGMRNLTQTGTLRVVGTRPLVFVVHGDAAINGTIDVGAAGPLPGPGGHRGCGSSAGDLGVPTGDAGGGGSGGGNGGAGGAGGSMPENDDGSSGGGTAGGLPLAHTSVLRGGCPGGPGNKDTQLPDPLPPGGAGGGALQISAAGTLHVQGILYADGSGGVGGFLANKSGGGGGGSGGTLVMQARSLDLSAGTYMLTGGGGGQGAIASAAGQTGFAGRAGGVGGWEAAAGKMGGSGGGADSAGSGGGNGHQSPDDVAAGGGGGGGGTLLELPL